MKSREKMQVIKKPFDKYGGKSWVLVRFTGGQEWVPSFEDLYMVITAICACEDEKYPNGRGRFFVRDFFKECCEVLRPGQSTQERWQELWGKYQFKERDSR